MSGESTYQPSNGFTKWMDDRLPIMRLAKTEIGREIVANVIALGAMIAMTGVVDRESGEKAVLAKVPEAFIDLNKKAYNLGFEKAKEMLAQ